MCLLLLRVGVLSVGVLGRDYYYSSGGLYDQAHQSAAQVQVQV